MCVGLGAAEIGNAPLEALPFGYAAYFVDVQLIKHSSSGNPGVQTVALGRIGT